MLLTTSTIVSSQKTTIKGFVKDSLQNPLFNANIIAKPQKDNLNMAFAISDELGRYKLILLTNETYNITVSYLGYKTVSYNITTQKNKVKNFILNEFQNQLDEVVIELPVTIKNDTLVYNTKHFVTGEERKLKNVLKKLPGVEVTGRGEVIVQGKKVTKMLVDGKFFFGGDSKLAVDNIPANAVDKIEVLDNYNEVAFLKNVSESDEMAMNIKLKEDKKRFVFGNVKVGLGNNNNYKTKTNLFYYSPKTNVNFIGNINSIAEEVFSFDDYLNFNGGTNIIFEDNFKLNKSDFLQFSDLEDLTKSKQQFSALNITKTTSSKLDVSGYFIYSNKNTNSLLKTFNNYISFNEQKTKKNNLKNILGIGNFTLKYKPDTNEEWSLKTHVKKNNSFKDNSILSIISPIENNINTFNDNKNWHVNTNIEWHKKQSEKHTFSTVINYTYNKGSLSNSWLTNTPILENLIPLNSPQAHINLQQLKRSKKQQFHSVFKDFWILNNNNHIYTTIGNTYLEESFNTNDVQLLEKNTTNNLFSNMLYLKHNDFFMGLHYKFRSGIFTFQQGVYLHNYQRNINQLNKITKNKWVALPDFLIKIAFNKSKNIQFNYNLETSFLKPYQLVDKFYLQSYNSIFKGSSNLENELFHSARLRYKRFSLYRRLTLIADIRYTKKVKGIKNAVAYEKTNRFITPILLNNADERYSINGILGKRIKKIRYNLSGRYNYSKSVQKFNTNFIDNSNKNYSFRIGAQTLFENLPKLNISYKMSIGNYTFGNSISNFTINEPSLKLKYSFLKGVNFSFDWTHYNYKNKRENTNSFYDIANAVLSYKKENSPWEFKCTLNNISKTQFKQNSSFSNYVISDTKTYILPSFFIFSITYHI